MLAINCLCGQQFPQNEQKIVAHMLQTNTCFLQSIILGMAREIFEELKKDPDQLLTVLYEFKAAAYYIDFSLKTLSQPNLEEQNQFEQLDSQDSNNLEEIETPTKFEELEKSVLKNLKGEAIKIVKKEDLFECKKCEFLLENINIMFTENCCHWICRQCLISHLETTYPKIKKATCPYCSGNLSDYEIKQLIGSELLDQLNSQLFNQIQENITQCPNTQCGYQFYFEPGIVNYNTKDQEGKNISQEAALHYAQNRVRCKCQTEFCIQCKHFPYHTGFTCQQFQTFLKSRQAYYSANVFIARKQLSKEKYAKNKSVQLGLNQHVGSNYHVDMYVMDSGMKENAFLA